MLNRREWVAGMGALTGLNHLLADTAKEFHLSTNSYPWKTFYQREGKTWEANLDHDLEQVVQAGFQGYEPNAASPEFVQKLLPSLKKHGLAMRSVYVNSLLHLQEKAAQSIDEVLKIAQMVAAAGTKIIVTNPSPIRWGRAEDKSDDQLKLQGESLNRLGEKLRGFGLTLAYHNHDIELRSAARELHHMLTGTDAQNVSFCLDAHWVYRGSGNSQVALFDVVQLYGKRIVELHLRQSVHGVWTETFQAGDIDYPRLKQMLTRMAVQPLLVMEQAVEAKTPNRTTVLQAHQESVAYAKKIFS